MGGRAAAGEAGVALPLALFALVMLTGLLVAFLSMAGMEPTIAANLTDVARGRHLAEAGIEWAFDQLVLNTDWDSLLRGPDGVAGTADDGTMANGQTLPGLAAAFGTFGVQIRNDIQAGDTSLTGLTALDPSGSATADQNGAVIVTASGTFNGMTRQVQVVVRRVGLPPFPGAYSMPGAQADLNFRNVNFSIDGRDWTWRCTANCSDPDPIRRTYTYELNPDQAKMKYGIGVQPGVQQNSPSGETYEQRAELTLNTAAKRNNVRGKDQTNPGVSTTGLNTVAPDAGLNPARMQAFLDQLASFTNTQIYQSTIACPMVLKDVGRAPNKPNLSNGCGLSKELYLGTKEDPQLLYFRGELDPTSSFTGLSIEGTIKGAGILIVEDGDARFQNGANFEWDGIVIVQGRYVSSIFMTGSRTTIYGATISNETVWDEGGSQNQRTYWDGWFEGNSVDLRQSQQNLDLVQRALLFRMSTWREI